MLIVHSQSARDAASARRELAGTSAAAAAGRRGIPTAVSEDTRLAIEIRGLVERNAIDEARGRFADLVALHQRRASRIAYYYLPDVFAADEAVPGAFRQAFPHINTFRGTWTYQALVH